jgi:DNA-binding NarL/FixJ family response regulator
MDLRDHVRIALKDVEPDLPLDLLRSGSVSRPLVRVRRQVVARALSAGYAGGSIAGFLNISPSSVSRVKMLLREGAPL